MIIWKILQLFYFKERTVNGFITSESSLGSYISNIIFEEAAFFYYNFLYNNLALFSINSINIIELKLAICLISKCKKIQLLFYLEKCTFFLA